MTTRSVLASGTTFVRRKSVAAHSMGVTALALFGSTALGTPSHAQESSATTPATTVTSAPGEAETARAADAAAPDATMLPDASPWRFEFDAWLWLMGVDGDMGVRGQTIDVSASISDIIDASDSLFALSGRLELGYGRVAGFVDGFWVDVGIDDATGPQGQARADISVNQTIVDFGLMYRIGDWKPSGAAAKNDRNLTLDLYAGARYSNLDVEFDFAAGPNLGDDRNWVDPIVGAKVVVPLAEHWHIATNGDIGGFGAASDLTWSATALVGFDFRLFDHPASVMLGYRAIGWDYTEGSGNTEFTWDVIEHGIMLGFGMRF